MKPLLVIVNGTCASANLFFALVYGHWYSWLCFILSTVITIWVLNWSDA